MTNASGAVRSIGNSIKMCFDLLPDAEQELTHVLNVVNAIRLAGGA